MEQVDAINLIFEQKNISPLTKSKTHTRIPPQKRGNIKENPKQRDIFTNG
jgi:hypothetical protein